MAYPGSKGWYVQKLKDLGVNRHPTERKRIELYKMYVVRNLYLELTNKK
ncbi:DUF2639 domain-containing protein [Cytobacillus sp. FJAT-54145]|uniref:DUF2639 domain-containing protein n=1 Tax=Cytobacillus spartinae TaxID=3299023 RepID=A0ABW6KCR6_9BACI